MKSFSDTKATLALTIAIIICFGCSLLFLRKIDNVRGPSLIRDTLYISSPSALKRMSLGYTGLLADIYWTRAVQYFGSHHARSAEEYNLLYPLLDITTTLDPKLIIAYRFGAIFLEEPPPQGAGQPDKAVELVKARNRHNPNDWRLYYDLGFCRHGSCTTTWAHQGRLRRAPSYPIATQRSKYSPPLTPAAAETWKLHAAVALLYETAANEEIRRNAFQHLQSMKADDDITELERLAEQYRSQIGGYPASFSDLIAAGMLRGVPLDPAGQPYKLLPDGKIQVQDPDALPFITKGAPPGWKSRNVIPEK